MFCKDFLKRCLVFFVVTILTACGKEEEFVTFTSSETENVESAMQTTEEAKETDWSKEDAIGWESATPTGRTTQDETIFVHVCGAVVTPGVYEISKDARVFEAIQMAGGCTDEASKDSLNLAQSITDGQRIYVPTKEEAATGSQEWQQPTRIETSGQEMTAVVNINTAGKEELMTLPGIGEAKADSILSYRQEKGSFSTIEEIKQISGIKDRVFEKIKDRITV